MTHQEALFALGVREDTLSCQEKTQLDEGGFLPLTQIITPGQAAQMRQATEEQFRARLSEAVRALFDPPQSP